MSEHLTGRTNNVLLCAPSNGAVNELVLRIVTDGLMDSTGNVTKVRAPSVHHEALSDERISIVRLGNAGEDASDVVDSVCLPRIIRREMAIHPKAMELESLHETQRHLRSSIRDFHNKAEDRDGPKKDRKALAKMHQRLTGCSDGPSVMERVQKVCSGVYAHTSFQPFLLYDVNTSREEDMNGSKYNRVEAAFCVGLCHNMFKTCADVRINKWSVGFVSPYKEQVRVLRQEITRSGIPASISIEVNTVDGFQGREKDVIVFSCVRSSRSGGIGFLRDVRRLNVAITRARYCLYVIGNVSTLMRDETWAALIKSARDRKLIIRTEGEDFSRVVERLAGDNCRGLAEHYKSMHVKVALKSIPTVEPAKSIANKPTEVTVSKFGLAATTKHAEASDVNMSEDEVPCGSTNNSKGTETYEASKSDRPSTDSASKEPRLQLSCDQNKSHHEVRQPVDSQKRSVEESLTAESAKKARMSEGAVPSGANMTDRYEIRRCRDRSKPMETDSHQRHENRSDEGVAGQTRIGCADLSRGEVREKRWSGQTTGTVERFVVVMIVGTNPLV
uniref:DNA2/NAM7 helicase-like C-terminal domain-containing protein n=1 Tax=Hyaloperonospora arabidopsidis (strain Emoy2) TaxID=559515 RepID=M4BI10_HYAAE